MAGLSGQSVIEARGSAHASGRSVFRLALLCLGIVFVGLAMWTAHVAQVDRAAAARALDAARLDLTDTLISVRDFRQAARTYLAAPAHEPIGPVSEAEWRLRARLQKLGVGGQGTTEIIAELDRLHNLLETVRSTQKVIGPDLTSGLLGRLKGAGDVLSRTLEESASARKAPAALKKLAADFEKARRVETVFLVSAGAVDPSSYKGELDLLFETLRAARIPAKTEAQLAGLLSS
ncbi:hypothetical protein [Breoghania sp.]|uniref:hypothetical protein n=1 Tax=Breoghania sp. TaxID=2065378 RepID=UPI00260F73B4|nr:hypothetical protein [Breoghania sp.]MDJ0932567.1 hypothetical protein [Breoghania sp.]